MAKKATSTKSANQNRAQKAKTLHEQNSKNRTESIEAIKATYRAERDGVVVQDILAKAKKWQSYHIKLAQDGVGARETGHKLVDGTKEVENYFLTNDEIAGEMKKAAGLQEMIDYIERQIAEPDPNPKVKK